MKIFDEAKLRVEADVIKHEKAHAGSPDWMMRQAHGLGLSFLRRCEQLGFDTPEEVDRFRKRIRLRLIEWNGEDEL